MAVVESNSSKPGAQRGITVVGVLSDGTSWSMERACVQKEEGEKEAAEEEE